MTRSGWSRRDLLLGAGAGGVLGMFGARARAQSSDKQLLVIVANGGWDPTFVFDPKLGIGPFVDLDPEDEQDTEILRQFGEIRITTNARRRPNVTSFFQNHAARTTVINGLWGGTLSHQDGMLRLLTGGLDAAAPDLVALAGHELGASYPLPALDAAGLGRPGPLSAATGRLGIRGQLTGLLSPEVRYPMPDGSARPDAGLTDDDWAAIRGFHRSREQLDPAWVVPGREEAWERADAFAATGDDLLALIPEGRRRLLEDDLAFILPLMSEGVCHSALVTTGDTWDTHADAFKQHSKFEVLFKTLDTLIPILDAQGLFDRLQIAVVSEMGRTPIRNDQNGTDHWPYTSALLFGADTVGGRQLGGTDDDVYGVPCNPSTGRPGGSGDPIQFANLVAGLLEGIGVEGALPGITPLRGYRE